MMIAGDLEQRNEKWFLLNRSHTCGRTLRSNPLLTGVKLRRARIYRTSYCKSSRGYLPDCHLPISPSPHNSSILLPRRILLRTGTKDVARSFLSFLETGLSTLDIEPLHCTVFPASSSNFDHNVYVYVLYIQADITDKTRHRKPSVYTRIYIYMYVYLYIPLYTLGRIGSFVHHRRQHQRFPRTRGLRAKCVLGFTGWPWAKIRREDSGVTSRGRTIGERKRGAPATLR